MRRVYLRRRPSRPAPGDASRGPLRVARENFLDSGFVGFVIRASGRGGAEGRMTEFPELRAVHEDTPGPRAKEGTMQRAIRRRLWIWLFLGFFCSAPRAGWGSCGDGVLDPGEQCDDGNT